MNAQDRFPKTRAMIEARVREFFERQAMTNFIGKPCMDCFRKDKKLEELRAEIERLQEQITVLRELRDCDQREIARLLALKR